jgi:hypothetical protein
VVNYEPSDVLPMEDFGLAWRITDSRWSSLPEPVLSRIKPLSDTKSRELFARSSLSRPVGSSADFGPLHVTRRQSLEESGSSEDDRSKRWFRELPIEPTQDVYVCWGIGDGVAAVTDWGTFTETWDALWYPFDRLCVFDDTLEWMVVFGPEEDVCFLEKPIERINA